MAAVLASCGGSSDGIKPSSTSIGGDAGDYFTVVEKNYPAFTDDKNSFYVELERTDVELPDAGRGYVWLTVEFLDKDGNILSDDMHQSDNVMGLKPGESTSICFYGPLKKDERSKVVSFKTKGYMEFYDMNDTQSSAGESANNVADIKGMSLEGNVGKYPISMWVEIKDGFATGWYRYTKTGSGAALDLDGTYSNGKLQLKEVSDGKVTGSWNINVDSVNDLTSTMTATGKMTNKASGKEYEVNLEGIAMWDESGLVGPDVNDFDGTVEPAETVSPSVSSSTSSNNGVDELFNEYEKAVNNYMNLLKKMASGDYSAATQLESVAKKLEDLHNKLAAKEDVMTMSQAERFVKIASEAASNVM